MKTRLERLIFPVITTLLGGLCYIWGGVDFPDPITVHFYERDPVSFDAKEKWAEKNFFPANGRRRVTLFLRNDPAIFSLNVYFFSFSVRRLISCPLC